MSVTVQIQGLSQMLNKLKNAPTEIKERVDGTIERSAQKISSQQKSKAPKFLGALASQTDYREEADGFLFFSNAEYAHIVEFGSGGKVSVPPELQAYASQFKGKPTGGTFSDFVKQLIVWVNRKGLVGTYSVKTQKRTDRGSNRKAQDSEAERIAFLIAISILKNGVKPQPFFFEPYLTERPKLLAEIQKLLKEYEG